MKQIKPTPAAEPAGLVGRHFHTVGETGEVQEQGKVVAQVDPTHYLVEFYEWFAGTPTYEKIYSIEQMTHTADGHCFQFYASGEERSEWWEAYGKYRMPKGEAAE